MISKHDIELMANPIDAIKQIPPVDSDALLKEQDLILRSKLAKEQIKERRRALFSVVTPVLKALEIKQTHLAKVLELDIDSLHQMLRHRNKLFGIIPERASEFASIAFGMSIHELMTGIDQATRLPRYLSVIVQHLLNDEIKTRQAISYISKDLWGSEEEERWREESYSPIFTKEYTIIELQRERIHEICESYYIEPSLVLGTKKSYIVDAFRRVTEPGDRAITQSISLPVLSVIAITLHTTVDYFTSIDYAGNTKIMLWDPDENGNPVIVEDSNILYLLSSFLELSKSGKEKAKQFLFKLIWRSITRL